MNLVISASLVLIAPGIFSVLSLAIPPKVRSFGFAVAALWILPGLAAPPPHRRVRRQLGIRTGLLLTAPVFLIGGLILALRRHADRRATSGGCGRQAAAQSEVPYERRQGRVKLLLVRGVDVHYDSVQVLFDVDFEVDEGEIVALLGTNGAGKSTLLKAISGLVEADRRGDRLRRPRHHLHARRTRSPAAASRRCPAGRACSPSLTVRREPRARRLARTARTSARRRAAHRARARALPRPARAARRAGRQPVGRPAADARARHGVHRPAPAAHDRRALARPRAGGRRAAARHRAGAPRRRAPRSSSSSSR